MESLLKELKQLKLDNVAFILRKSLLSVWLIDSVYTFKLNRDTIYGGSDVKLDTITKSIIDNQINTTEKIKELLQNQENKSAQGWIEYLNKQLEQFIEEHKQYLGIPDIPVDLQKKLIIEMQIKQKINTPFDKYPELINDTKQETEDALKENLISGLKRFPKLYKDLLLIKVGLFLKLLHEKKDTVKNYLEIAKQFTRVLSHSAKRIIKLKSFGMIEKLRNIIIKAFNIEDVIFQPEALWRTPISDLNILIKMLQNKSKAPNVKETMLFYMIAVKKNNVAVVLNEFQIHFFKPLIYEEKHVETKSFGLSTEIRNLLIKYFNLNDYNYIPESAWQTVESELKDIIRLSKLNATSPLINTSLIKLKLFLEEAIQAEANKMAVVSTSNIMTLTPLQYQHKEQQLKHDLQRYAGTRFQDYKLSDIDKERIQSFYKNSIIDYLKDLHDILTNKYADAYTNDELLKAYLNNYHNTDSETKDDTKTKLDDLIDFINALTGRGNLPFKRRDQELFITITQQYREQNEYNKFVEGYYAHKENKEIEAAAAKQKAAATRVLARQEAAAARQEAAAARQENVANKIEENLEAIKTAIEEKIKINNNIFRRRKQCFNDILTYVKTQLKSEFNMVQNIELIYIINKTKTLMMDHILDPLKYENNIISLINKKSKKILLSESAEPTVIKYNGKHYGRTKNKLYPGETETLYIKKKNHKAYMNLMICKNPNLKISGKFEEIWGPIGTRN